MKITFIIPVYNEEKNLLRNYKKVESFILSNYIDCECVIVNDASTDSSPEILMNILALSPLNIKIVNLKKNSGQHNAILAGMKISKGEYIITVDADLQIPVNNLKKIIQLHKNNFDIISGWRKKRNDPLIRRLISFLLNIQISIIFKKKINDIGSMMKSYNRKTVDKILKNKTYTTFIPTLALNLGSSMREIKVSHNKREEDKSKYSVYRLIHLYLNLISEIIPFTNLIVLKLLFPISIVLLFVFSSIYKVNIFILFLTFLFSLFSFILLIFSLIIKKKMKSKSIVSNIINISENKDHRFLFIVEKKYLSLYKFLKIPPSSLFIFKRNKGYSEELKKSFLFLKEYKIVNNILSSTTYLPFIQNTKYLIQYIALSKKNLSIVLLSDSNKNIQYLRSKNFIHFYLSDGVYKYDLNLISHKKYFSDIIDIFKKNANNLHYD